MELCATTSCAMPERACFLLQTAMKCPVFRQYAHVLPLWDTFPVADEVIGHSDCRYLTLMLTAQPADCWRLDLMHALVNGPDHGPVLANDLEIVLVNNLDLDLENVIGIGFHQLLDQVACGFAP